MSYLHKISMVSFTYATAELQVAWTKSVTGAKKNPLRGGNAIKMGGLTNGRFNHTILKIVLYKSIQKGK